MAINVTLGASISRKDFTNLFRSVKGVSIMRCSEWRDVRTYTLTLDIIPAGKPVDVDVDVLQSGLQTAFLAVIQSIQSSQSSQEEHVGASLEAASASSSSTPSRMDVANQEATPLSEASDHHVAKRSKIDTVHEDRRNVSSQQQLDAVDHDAAFEHFLGPFVGTQWYHDDYVDIGEDINHLYMDIDYS